MMWARHVAGMGEIKEACKILVGKSEGRRTLERRRHTLEHNSKMYPS